VKIHAVAFLLEGIYRHFGAIYSVYNTLLTTYKVTRFHNTEDELYTLFPMLLNDATPIMQIRSIELDTVPQLQNVIMEG
jgi:hypothetical protein